MQTPSFAGRAAARTFAPLPPLPLRPPAACRMALALAAAAFDVSAEEIRAAGRRTAVVSLARHVAIYIAHVVFQLPMQCVAEGFGRDRTSVGHAVRRVEERRDGPEFDRLMDRLERLALFCARTSETRP